MGRVAISYDERGQPIICEYDDRFSFQDFTNQKHIFEGRADELKNAVIYKSQFYQEDGPDAMVFPPDIPVTLVWCGLDNVLITDNMTLIECTTRRIMHHDDGTNWVVDEKNNFVEPVSPPPPLDPTLSKAEAMTTDDLTVFKQIIDKYDIGAALRADIADAIDRQVAEDVRAQSLAEASR